MWQHVPPMERDQVLSSDAAQMMVQHRQLFNSGDVITPKNFERATAYNYFGPLTPSSNTNYKEDYFAQLERRSR